MVESKSWADPERLLVVLPNWVGDVVLATPVLRALRTRFPTAQITYLMRPYVGDIVRGCGWHDRELLWPAGEQGTGNGKTVASSTWDLVKAVRRTRFEWAILLTNSFRSALVAWLGGVPRRLGYARDGRSLLLTERLHPKRENGRFVPGPMLHYYMKLAARVGCHTDNTRLELGVTPEQEKLAADLKTHYGFGANQPYAVINPGAAFGAAKCWLPERFSQVCGRLANEWGWQAVLVGAPNERPLMREIAQRAATPVTCCDDPGTTLGSLKPLVRDAALLICNDTGPRHYGNAFAVPTVTIFGSTFAAWTDTDYAGETKLQIEVDCGPCMLRTCPLDHRCMKGVTTDMVMDAIVPLIKRGAASRGAHFAGQDARPTLKTQP